MVPGFQHRGMEVGPVESPFVLPIRVIKRGAITRPRLEFKKLFWFKIKSYILLSAQEPDIYPIANQVLCQMTRPQHIVRVTREWRFYIQITLRALSH